MTPQLGGQAQGSCAYRSETRLQRLSIRYEVVVLDCEVQGAVLIDQIRGETADGLGTRRLCFSIRFEAATLIDQVLGEVQIREAMLIDHV